MNHFYVGALSVDFSIYNILSGDNLHLQERYRQKYLGYIGSANPLTKEIYNDPAFAHRRDEVKGTPVWTMVGGQELWLISGGKAQKALDEIMKEFKGYAVSIARNARKDNGWQTGPKNDYRITPDGRKTSSNGMPIGKYAMPWSMDEGGEFNGSITDDVKFTH